MGATIFDVAKHAGVSIGTVSRVLNNRDRVHPKTRERVLKSIEALNFSANAYARGLANQQTDTLGLVIPQVNDSFYFEIVRGVEDAATEAGYRLLIASQPRHSEEHRYLDLFQRSYVDAMVLVAIDVHIYELREVIDRGVPVVLVHQNIDKSVPSFQADNFGGGREITQHLIGHGYTRLAYITGTDHTPDNRDRLRGMRDALNSSGLSLEETNILAGDFLPGSGYRAALELMRRPELPHAIFAANDQMAVDAIKALREHGLRVPDDIAVVGFDDVLMAQYVSPTLTTVHQPLYELGLQAAQMVLTTLQNQENVRSPALAPSVLLPTTLKIRQSCGCKG
ncbi:MAG: LacI family DNA-binding transcriptional regulator [Anaerolinea sp.]|nr:LacI family DNA-binding transcriptional regulator [Anaerolinea sp.]MCC6975390.1 LacI family DNA-binding transcriptional regulator [Anaerolineae bacterium]CAG1013905.1 Catabolite control protein A [Anaerolineales bacterium]